MLQIHENLSQKRHFYHLYHKYYGDPADDTTWEVGESYIWVDAPTYKNKLTGEIMGGGHYEREFIPLPYDPIFFITDEERIKNRIFAFSEENPLQCDIHNRKQLEGSQPEATTVMSASIPKGMIHLLMDD